MEKNRPVKEFREWSLNTQSLFSNIIVFIKICNDNPDNENIDDAIITVSSHVDKDYDSCIADFFRGFGDAIAACDMNNGICEAIILKSGTFIEKKYTSASAHALAIAFLGDINRIGKHSIGLPADHSDDWNTILLEWKALELDDNSDWLRVMSRMERERAFSFVIGIMIIQPMMETLLRSSAIENCRQVGMTPVRIPLMALNGCYKGINNN